MTGQSAIEETRRCLNNIERFDSVVNAFISVLAESALREAESIDRAREQGPRHQLVRAGTCGQTDGTSWCHGWARLILARESDGTQGKNIIAS